MTLRVSRNGLPAHEFVFDDLHLVGEPEARALDLVGAGLMLGRWQAMNAGRAYLIEAAPSVTGVWSVTQGLVATGAVQDVMLTNTAASTRFWRMLRP